MAASFNLGTIFAVLQMRDQITGPYSAIARSVATKSGEIEKHFEGVAVRIAKVNSLVRDFSGIPAMRTAEEYAAAVAKIGGAARLTEADQLRVNKAMRDALDHAKALGQEAPKHLHDLEQATRRLEPPTQGVIGRVKEMALAYIAGIATMQTVVAVGRKIIDVLKDSVQQYLDAEQGQRRLTTALEVQRTAIPAVLKLYDDLATKYKTTTVFSGDLIKETQALLAQVGGVLPSEMDKALDAVTNLASGLQIDLRSATLMVAKAFEDNFKSLKNHGVQIDDTRAKLEGMSYVLGQVQAKFGNQAQSELETYAGKLKQLENNWNDLKQELGRTLVESGLLSAALLYAHLVIGLLSDQLRRFMAVMNTMPSATALAISPVQTMAKWMRDSTAELGRMEAASRSSRGQLGKMAPVASHVSGELAVLEARIRAERVEEERRNLALKKSQEAQEAARRAAEANRREVQAGADFLSGRVLLRDLKLLEDQVKALTAAELKRPDVMKRIADRAEELRQRGAQLTPQLQSLVHQFHGMDTVVIGTGGSLKQFTGVLGVTGDQVRETGQRVQNLNKDIDRFNQMVRSSKPLDILKVMPNVLDFAPLVAPAKKIGDLIEDRLFQAANEFPGMLANAILHGQSINEAFRALMVGTAGDIGRMWGQSLAKEGSQLAKFLGGAFGAAASIAVDLLIKGIEKAFGNVTKKAREQFAEQMGFGSLEKLYQDLRRLGAEGEKLAHIGVSVIGRNDEAGNRRWMDDVRQFYADIARKQQQLFSDLSDAAADFGGKAPAHLQPFIQELLRAKQLTADERDLLAGLAGEPSWQTLQEMAEELGVRLESLGPKFQQARIDDIAMRYARAFMTFRDAGADMGAVLTDAQDKVQALVLDALRAGAALPAALEPFLQQMIDMGLLVDENGEKLTDLSRFEFKGTIEDAFAQMKTVLEEIRDLLANKIPDEAERGWKRIRDRYQEGVDVPVRFKGAGPGVGGEIPPPGDMPDLPQAARGGVVTRPTVLLAGEAGPEAIIPLDRSGLRPTVAGPTTVNFNVSTPIATIDTIRQLVYDELGPLFLDWIENNKNGARSRAQAALGVTVG